MSADSLAISRRHAGDDLTELAERHMQHDLTADDRDALNAAAKSFGVHTALGSLAGVALGAALFMRTRSARMKLIMALNKPAARPVEVRFRTGGSGSLSRHRPVRSRDSLRLTDADVPIETEPVPEISQLLDRTPLTDVAASLLFGVGGLFVGGELGTLTGAWSARRAISRGDPEAEARVENAFRRFQADVLRKRAEELERKAGGQSSILESAKSVVGWK